MPIALSIAAVDVKEAIRPAKIRAAIADAIGLACHDFIVTSNAGGASLRARFEPQGFGLNGYADRSADYRRSQIRADGVVRPFVSPRRNMVRMSALVALANSSRAGGPGMFLAAASAAAQLAKAGRPHMRDVVRKPGGYRIEIIRQGGRAGARMSFPGARILNRIRPGFPYAEEFSRLSAWEARGVLIRARQILDRALSKGASA